MELHVYYECVHAEIGETMLSRKHFSKYIFPKIVGLSLVCLDFTFFRDNIVEEIKFGKTCLRKTRRCVHLFGNLVSKVT